MKKKIVWLVASSLMVLALVAASCAPAAKEEAPKEKAPVVKEVVPKKEAAPVVEEKAPAEEKEMIKVTLTKVDGTVMEKLVEKPKYGGTLNVLRTSTILAWDEAIQAPWTLSSSLEPTNQDLLIADWRRGLAGTGEREWFRGDWLTLDYVTGQLAESFEIPEIGTIIFHIRKGVHFALDPNSEASRLVGGREFTADDAVFSLKRIYMDITTSTMYGMVGVGRPTEIYATDKYTLVMKVPPQFFGDAFENIADFTKMVPPEVVKKYGNMNQWENVVGTGPFILKDYVPMSLATWVRNPNYWEYDPILGKDYPLPYLDTYKTPIIPDRSTQLAALRTGKVDGFPSLEADDALPLLKSHPHLLVKQGPTSGCRPLGFRVDKPELPFKDIRVRRALLLAIDDPSIAQSCFGGRADIINYKVAPAQEYINRGWYTPLEQLPPSTRELFEYHPEKAKQLLAEAGYPQGFKTEVVVQGDDPSYMDMVTLAKFYWAKIGVDLKLDTKEFGVFMSIYQRKTHKEMLLCGRGGMPSSMYLCRKGNMYNWSMIDDPKIDDYYYPEIAATAFVDDAKHDKLMKEMNLYVLSQAWYWTPARSWTYSVRQPWVKNHHGTTNLGNYSSGNFHRYLWVDQELKKALGY